MAKAIQIDQGPQVFLHAERVEYKAKVVTKIDQEL